MLTLSDHAANARLPEATHPRFTVSPLLLLVPRPAAPSTPDTRHLYEFESKKGLRLDAYCQRDESEKSWEELVQHLLNKGGYTDDDLINSRKSAAWKLELASRIKSRSGVTNAWLAQRLNLGNPTRASHQIKQWRTKT